MLYPYPYHASLVFIWAFAITGALSAQPASVFDTNPSAIPLEFRNKGQTAGKLTFRFQDSRGFVWGADEYYRPIRFDGSQFELFEHDPEDTTSASSGKLWDVTCSFFEDSRGKIWIAYSSGGYLDCFDPVTERFQRFRSRMRSTCTLNVNDQVRKVFEDHQGHIWIPTGKRLFRYDALSDALHCFEMPHHVTLVFEDANHHLWVHFQYRFLARIDPETGAMEEKVAYPERYKPTINKNWGYTYPDRHYAFQGENLHLLAIRGSLYEFDAEKQKIAWLHQAPLSDESLIYSFYAKDELILLATLSGEVFQYRADAKMFTSSPLFRPSSKEASQEYTLPYLLFQSTEGILWANVYQGGNKQTKNIQFFPSKLDISKVPLPPEFKGVRLAVSRPDHCFLFSGRPYFFTHPQITPLDNADAMEQTIDLSFPGLDDPWSLTYHFKEAPNGHLWQAASPVSITPNLTIREFDQTGKLLNQYVRNKEDTSGYSGGILRDIQFDQTGNLWVLSIFGGLSRFDPVDGRFTDFSEGLDGGRPYVLDMLIDRQNNVWACGGFGLKTLDQKTEKWTSKIKDEKVRSLFEDSRGNIWFCTENEVGVMDPLSNKSQKYGVKEGFSGNGYHIFEDHHHQIWVHSDSKLFLYHKEQDHFLGFGEKEGVFLAEVYHKPIVIDSMVILPGSGLEVYLLKPHKISMESKLPNLYFTDFQLFNKKIDPSTSGILEKGLDYTERIQLRYAQNDFTIHYTTTEFIYPDRLEFISRMQGFNDTWQNLGNKREIRYTNLSPGNYTFQLKVRNHLGDESQTPRSLSITILPPWYRSWWAYTVWVAILFGGIYGFYRFQLRRQLEQAEAKRLKELDLAKSRLYTNITHEFRTPLTIILGMAEQMKADPKNWFREGLRLIRRNGKQLLQLVNQMLDLSKLESGHMTLKMTHRDVVKYLQYLTESFHSYAEGKDIRLHFASEMKSLEMDYDEEKLQNAFSNLISNAIKFTQAGGDVYIQLSVVKDAAEQVEKHLMLTVRDNGPGIAKEQLPHIFDRFYQVDDTHTRRGEGTGIGLALTKELLQLMGGKIKVESELEWGTKFTILLPISKFRIRADAGLPVSSNSEIKDSEQREALYLSEVPQGDLPMVLLIEDNPDVITYLSSFLSNEYVIVTANNGKQGVEKAIERTPDLVVSDVMMPEMDGFEVCEVLKKDERTSHIPIILLTAKSDSKAKLEGLGHGADAYLTKPFNREELLIRIEKLIALRRKLQSHFEKSEALLKVKEKPQPTVEEQFLQKLIKIVEENYADEHFGSPELCRKAGLSRSQLFRKLKAITGRSITNFIRSIRLTKGKEMLETTDKTVSEVAYASGFNSLNYFSKMFKEEFGMSPSGVRKR